LRVPAPARKPSLAGARSHGEKKRPGRLTTVVPMPEPSSPPGPFLAACRGLPVAYTPVWFMRQAGRSLPEYRAIRGSETILDAIRQPELAAEITLQPVRRYGVDAAVLFSDIIAPVAAVGFEVDIQAGVGPVAERPFREASDLARVRPLEPPVDLPWVADTIRILIKELKVPLIGFAGGPFTLASYLIEGRPSRDYIKTKSLMHGDPSLWFALVERLADLSTASLRDQIEAGAAAVQVFDSWSGALSPADYERFVLPAARRIFDGTADLSVPRIHFGVGTGELLGPMAAAGAEVIGVDWRVPLRTAAARAPSALAVQGNLDPAICLAPWSAVAEATSEILRQRPDGIGHIFNLGHGVLPNTDPGILARIVDLVHEYPGEPLRVATD
jgi:uroporphyrinogen decarboxylase